ncbi:MAG: histidinol dehydrogenase [Rhodospirillaceae bacterium]|jgi:histidinol dehydrogenase|nr:histidinol dehydrogenase [Rhodospirillaceae bacterium]MBT7265265.1 histidinol dehydrogenase [Rhodospirillaceae bacterium]
MPSRLKSINSSFAIDFDTFLNIKREAQIDVEAVVADIVADIRTRGDAALLEYTTKFDRFELTAATIRVTPEEIAGAIKECSAQQLDALSLAAGRIKAFHEKQLPEDLSYQDQDGVQLGLRWSPVDAVGMYVPGGLASYPSSVLMNAIPAKVAGCKRLVMVVPTPDGEVNPLVLAAASLADVDEIYRVGGAQAVAALAFGTESIAPVDKIVGPGNAYVATAKRQVFGVVGIDMIAGPSEILVVADNKNDPSWIAADLLSQAEHDSSAQAILITDDEDFADAVVRAVDVHLQKLPRSEIAGQSWRDFGAVITVELMEHATVLIDRLAPEHLELAIDAPEAFAGKLSHAGAIFLGRHTPEALGDYIGGPNHVLPTGRSARFSSGLGVLDFMKRTTLLGVDAQSIQAIGPAAVTLAEAEGLHAHALSVALRLADSETAAE